MNNFMFQNKILKSVLLIFLNIDMIKHVTQTVNLNIDTIRIEIYKIVLTYYFMLCL